MKFLAFAAVFHIWRSLYTVYKMIFTTVVTEINSLFMRLIKLRDTQSDCSGTLKSQPPKFSGRKICSEAK